MSTPKPTDNITNLLRRIRLSAEKHQRVSREILLVAVSKTRPQDDIRNAHAFGLNNFGENYLQEALSKIEALADLPLIWHFIGPLQSNKTRLVAEHFQWVQSVDRIKIARRLNAYRPAHLPPLQVCIQVNVSGEASKSGVRIAQLPELAREIASLPQLTLRGLMAIPAATNDQQAQRQAFSSVRLALEHLKLEFPELDTLSMGMSGDFEAAIAEGSTMIRIGTAIFGPRNPQGQEAS